MTDCLDKKQFASALPALRKVTEQPVAKVSPTPSVIEDVSLKLRDVNENTQDYWPTVLQFIQFASAGLSLDVPPPGDPNLLVSYSRGMRFGTVSRKIVLLDGSDIVDTRFEHCRIIFTKNPTPLRNVVFVDSVFEFPISDHPVPYIQKAARVLLASDLKSVSANL